MMRQELLRSYDRRVVWIRDLAVVLAAAYVLALSAQVRLLLPFSPVPVTGQTLVVLLIGAFMGRRKALASVGTYLVAGMVGLPFFAGRSLWGPTGGYLLGFGLAAYLIASVMDQNRGAAVAIAALFAGNLVIYLAGVPWLAVFVGPQLALPLGFFPFIVGDLAKLTCAAGIVLARDQFRAKGA
jgi:biotin transport system substrate-specific component